MVEVGETNTVVWLRRIVLIFALLALAFSLSGLIFSGNREALTGIGLLLIAGVFACLFLLLSLVFSFWTVVILGCVSAVVILAPFFSVLTLIQQLVFAVLFLVFLVVSGMRAISRTENSIQFSSLEAVRSGRGLLILFVTLVLSLFYGANFLNNNSFPLTENNIYDFFRPSEPLVQQFYPGFSFRMTWDDFFQLAFDKQKKGMDAQSLLKNFGGDLGAATLNNLGIQLDLTSVTAEIEQQARTSFFSQVSAIVGRDVAPGEKISQAALIYLQDKYNSLPIDADSFFGEAIFLIIFLFVWGTLAFLGFFLDVIFWLVFSILQVLGLVRISTITVEKEVLSL